MSVFPTVKQYRVMLYILEHGSATWKELKRFYSGDSALANSLRSMIANKWIKKINGNSRRPRYVLTSRGLMVLARADQRYKSLFI